MKTKNRNIRLITCGYGVGDRLTVWDLMDYNIGKSILVDGVWYTVYKQDKDDATHSRAADNSFFWVKVADFEDPEIRLWSHRNPLPNNGKLSFRQIIDNVNAGKWGFQHKDESRGRQGWFGAESPRHEGRHDEK